ncbi:MAG: pyridoxal-phosphate dependent enzyme [Capsulimonadales bacterium]|nr:pyridoxal-phosphate dependent enzyme [Capsulimonadales bacterium]
MATGERSLTGEPASVTVCLMNTKAEADVDPTAYDTTIDTAWVRQAVRAIHADMRRSADTHLLRFPLPATAFDGLALYLKDESTHPTGSLKHRLARSLFLYALCNGKITNPDVPVYEASSGSTAISEAYFAQLIGLRNFYAVVPARTAPMKLRLIEDYGGKVLRTEDDVIAEAKRQAAANNGYFVDQFTFSERATDWRGNNNIAETIFEQMEQEPESFRIPQWVVVGAGTGGTSATIGRYARYKGFDTRVCVADPPESSYFSCWARSRGRESHTLQRYCMASPIEGIGRPTPADSFLPEIIDGMVTVPNEASVGAMLYLYQTGRYYCGVSTGTNLIGAIQLLEKMRQEGQSGSLVTLICDSGLRYAQTYYDSSWRSLQRYPDGSPMYDESLVTAYMDAVRAFLERGRSFPYELLSGRIAVDFT